MFGGGILKFHPNPFSSKIEKLHKEKDSSVAWFLKSKIGKSNPYSKQCAWSGRLVPVVLTDKEKENIVKNQGEFDK